MELVKEWTLCVMMKAGLMTKEGVYLIDVALQQVPHEGKDILLLFTHSLNHDWSVIRETMLSRCIVKVSGRVWMRLA